MKNPSTIGFHAFSSLISPPLSFFRQRSLRKYYTLFSNARCESTTFARIDIEEKRERDATGGGGVERPADREVCSRLALETRSRNIIHVCAPRACRVIGRRKLTCEQPGNIARIKKPDEMGREQLANKWEGTRIKIAENAHVFSFFSFFCCSTPLTLGAVLTRSRVSTSLVRVTKSSIILHFHPTFLLGICGNIFGHVENSGSSF